MAQFAIYHIKFLESQELNLNTVEMDRKQMLADARQHFAELFTGETLPYFSNYEDNEYPNYVWKQDNDIFVIRFHNSTWKSYIDLEENPEGGAPKWSEKQKKSNPFCHIIVDNRPGYGQIAIEKSAAWSSQPDNVVIILQEVLSKVLSNNYGIEVEFRPKMQPTKVWAYVTHRVHDLHDPITKVCFEVDNPDMIKGYQQPESISAGVESMQAMVKATNALKAVFTLHAQKADPLSVDEKVEDVKEMVRLCANNAYHMVIYFKRHKAYRCDEKVKAFYPLKEDDIENFKNGSKVLNVLTGEPVNEEDQEYALVQWLEYVYKDTKNCEDGEKIHKRRSRKNKK